MMLLLQDDRGGYHLVAASVSVDQLRHDMGAARILADRVIWTVETVQAAQDGAVSFIDEMGVDNG
jgi:hypothetical protein